ncbi:protein of unknown function [Denitratisoma oestradiolicum]|uniref:Uncharacterized protein n=1 Tax=Denitratisoma oestradiolicum TaxID=311182 RepID=A0A6S6Y9A3_9PROT|nr:protein of unknown function [Denitratisoma oestradiolicum]
MHEKRGGEYDAALESLSTEGNITGLA